MIFSENRYPRIKSGAGFFGIMLQLPARAETLAAVDMRSGFLSALRRKSGKPQ